MRWCRATRVVGVLAAAVSAALVATCDYGQVVVVQPAATGHGPLTLSIQADPEDTAVVRELGWGAGIPGAEVTISPGNADTATGPAVAVLQTDSVGSASVADLLDGNYLIEVRRLLTAAEVARLAPTEDVVGVMAREMVKRGNATVAAPASRRRSLVISEWAFNPGWIQGVGDYVFGGYLELTNNADTTVYLDGLVIGEGFAQAADFVPGRCAQFEAWTNDPEGIWSRFLDSVPGTGHDYPLAPGTTAVVATDAIDHSAIVPGGLDLSHAKFEFAGPADVDNPMVPNMVNIGSYPHPLGHGMVFGTYLTSVVFIALRLNLAVLPRQREPQDGIEYARIPKDRILDAIALLSTFPFTQPLCPHLVHRNFDRHRARMMEGYNVGVSASVSRKVAYTRPDGRAILQHTRTSNADFFVGPRTPGWLP